MLDLRKGRTILPNTGVFCVPPLPTNSQKWKSGFFEGYGEGLPPYFHHHSSTNCPQTAVTTAMLIITGKWRQNHLAMGSRQPGVQHSNPLSTKAFPEENSTWCSRGQHFPGCVSPTPRASSSSSSTHPNCPIKAQPHAPPRQQAVSYLGQLHIWKGRNWNGYSGYILSCLSGDWDWRQPCLCVCARVCVHVCIVFACLREVSIPNKTKFLPLKRKDIQNQCFSKCVPQNMCYKQRCPLVLFPKTKLNHLTLSWL